MNVPKEVRIAIVGGGPAGLMAAETIIKSGAVVNVFEANPSVGRKFLIAGKGGLNLTHSEDNEAFLSRFSGSNGRLADILAGFGAQDLRNWAEALGVETFIGTSGRVFPKDMKAAPLLRAWVQRLKKQGVGFHTRHRWLGWGDDDMLKFEVKNEVKTEPADAVVLALGGASWPQTGSDGGWVPLLAERGVGIVPLEPANCGFNAELSDHLRARFAGRPVKSVVMHFDFTGVGQFRRRGEFILTETGLEGSLVYAASRMIREQIKRNGQAVVYLDLAPDRNLQTLVERLSKPRGRKTMASHLKRQVGIAGIKSGLLYEFGAPDDFQDPKKLAYLIKNVPVLILSPRPLEEAISTAGGVSFDALDQNLMLQSLPGVFCAGEMLDWEAPTGGYLLTASFSTGKAAGEGVLRWLGENS